MNLKSYTFRIHSSIIVKDFHRRLRVKTFQMFDFILCFRQKLRESVHAFVQIQLARAVKTQRVKTQEARVVLGYRLGRLLRFFRA